MRRPLVPLVLALLAALLLAGPAAARTLDGGLSVSARGYETLSFGPSADCAVNGPCAPRGTVSHTFVDQGLGFLPIRRGRLAGDGAFDPPEGAGAISARVGDCHDLVLTQGAVLSARVVDRGRAVRVRLGDPASDEDPGFASRCPGPRAGDVAAAEAATTVTVPVRRLLRGAGSQAVPLRGRVPVRGPGVVGTLGYHVTLRLEGQDDAGGPDLTQVKRGSSTFADFRVVSASVEDRVAFRGGPGCGRLRLCDVRGLVVHRLGHVASGPSSAGLATLGREVFGYVELHGRGSTTASVRRDNGTRCTDAVPRPDDVLTLSGSRRRVRVDLHGAQEGEGGDLLTTRCAGPRLADLAGPGARPVLAISTARLLGPRTVRLVLRGGGPVSGRGFAGSVRSRVVLVLRRLSPRRSGRLELQPIFTNEGDGPFTAALRGSVRVDFAGDPAAGCAQRGVCAERGSVELALRGDDLSAVPLDLGRPARGYFLTGFASAMATDARVDDGPGARCADTLVASELRAVAVAVRRGRTLIVRPLDDRAPDLAGDPLATRCPGPRLADLVRARALPAVRLAARRLRPHGDGVTLRDQGSRPFHLAGLSGTVTSDVTVTLIPPRCRHHCGDGRVRPLGP